MELSFTSTYPGKIPENYMDILLIDDDRDFRGALAENLRDDGHQVWEYENPGELPPIIELGNIGAVLSDYQMDAVDGLTLADRFHAAHPGVPVVLMTAYWSRALDAEVAQREYLYLRRKPLDYEDVQAVLQSASNAAPRPPRLPK